MHSIWTLDIGRETIGNKTLQRRANVEPISRANVHLKYVIQNKNKELKIIDLFQK
jgi:hypothetical protein